MPVHVVDGNDPIPMVVENGDQSGTDATPTSAVSTLAADGEGSDVEGAVRWKKPRKERKKGLNPPRRRSQQYNLKDILTKKGTNRFRPMSDVTVEDILLQVVHQTDEVKEWSDPTEMFRIVENLSYLLDKHRRTVTEDASLKKETVADHQLRTMCKIEGKGRRPLLSSMLVSI